METTIVKIGNSQGLIIPKSLLHSLGDSKKFDVRLKDGGLLITPCEGTVARQGWEKQFATAIENGHKPDEDLPFCGNDFDDADWTW